MTVKAQAAVILRAAEGGAFEEYGASLSRPQRFWHTDDVNGAALAALEELLGEPIRYLAVFDRPFRELRSTLAWYVVHAARAAWLRRARGES